MPNPEVRYCTAKDGVHIAYCVEGEGPPVVIIPFFLDSFSLDHLVPEIPDALRIIAEDCCLIRFDTRGTGLSQRDVPDMSASALQLDVDAVVQTLGLRRFSLVASAIGTLRALDYAIAHPERIDRLVLYAAFARVFDAYSEDFVRGFVSLARSNWPLAARTFADNRDEFGLRFAEVVRQSTTGETVANFVERNQEVDLTARLIDVNAPTLLIYAMGDTVYPIKLGEKLTAAISDVRLVTLPNSAFVGVSDKEAAHKASAFLRAGRESGSMGLGEPVDAQDRPQGLRRPDAPLRSALEPVSEIEATFHYAQTSEGVSIAYGVAGEGVPLILLTSPPICHVQLDWESAFRELMLGFAASFRFVWLDWHGTGMSDRETSADFTIDAMLRDVDAVVERVAFDRFAIVSQATAVPIAITYAARHPGRVTHLILADGFAEPEDWRSTAWAPMAAAIQDQDWTLYTETMARVFIGENVPAGREALASFAAYIRACVDQSTMLALSDAFAHYRVSSLLAEIATPTLVLATGHGMVAPETASQRIAARIPGAEYRKFGHSPAELHTAVSEFILGKQVSARSPYDTMAASAVTSQSFGSGRYVVSRLLGEGGQKIVYLARDTQLDRDVAIALLKAEGIDDASLARLKREAQALAHLEAQPHIVAIYDIGEHERRPFTVCEYLAGGNLEQELARAGGPLPVERAVAIAQDVCRALIVAHGSDIVHRDIKPSNIWLTASGNAKLGDFGLATALGRSHLTQAGTIMGTAAYMAPEQALGHEADQRSDIYSLGCVLYEMLAGRPPFVGDGTVAVVYQHVEAAPAALSELQADLPPALERIVLQMLAKAPEDRPQTAVEVLAALEGNAPTTSDAPARVRTSPVVTSPQVQYAKTSDGVRIAYTVTGSGPPLVYINDPMGSHVELEWSLPVVQRLYSLVASTRTFIRLDPRGVGMSDRVLPMSAEDSILDINAVVDRIGISTFALVGVQAASQIVIPYAACCASRVERLVLIDGYLRTRDMLETPHARALLAAAASDFNVATEAIGAIVYGLGREENASVGGFIRACIGPELLAHAPILTMDATEYVGAVAAPTLVIRHEGMQVVTPEMTRDIVARLSDGRLVTIPGLTADNVERLADLVIGFINEE